MVVRVFDGNTEACGVLFMIYEAGLVGRGREARVCWGLVSIDWSDRDGRSVLLFLAIGHCALKMLVEQMWTVVPKIKSLLIQQIAKEPPTEVKKEGSERRRTTVRFRQQKERTFMIANQG